MSAPKTIGRPRKTGPYQPNIDIWEAEGRLLAHQTHDRQAHQIITALATEFRAALQQQESQKDNNK
jgi:hypothetical protein